MGGYRRPFIRAVARSGHWQLRYRNSLRAKQPLLDKPIIELNINQLRLLEWLDFYKELHQLPEKIPEQLLKYDILVDFWLEDFLSKQKRSNKKYRFGKKPKKDYQNTVKF